MKTTSQWVDYKDLKSKVSALRILTDFGIELPRQNGDQHYGPCPLPCHAGDRDNPNAFSLNTEKNCWRCLTHCQGGNVIDLYCHLSQRDPTDKTVFREAALEMQTRYLGEELSHSPQPPRSSKRTKPKPAPLENSPIKIELQVKKDIPYLLEEKRLPLSLLEEFGIGFCSNGMFSGRVVIPLHNQSGQRIGYAGRGMKQSDITKRGRWLLPKSFHKSIELFNQHRLPEQKILSEQGDLVVVEGFWSCLRLHQANIPAVALMGSELSEAQLQRLMQLTNKIWLMLDNDEAGKKASEKILHRLADCIFVRRVVYPEDQDRLQPEDFTPEELQELIPV